MKINNTYGRCTSKSCKVPASERHLPRLFKKEIIKLNNMNKKNELEQAIVMLEEQVEQNKTMSAEHLADLAQAKKQLADVNKPELTAAQFDLIWMAIEEGVNSYDFSDSDNFDKEFGIDYDGRVTLENFDINTPQELVEAISEEVSKLFTEVKDDNSQVNNATHVEKVI